MSARRLLVGLTAWIGVASAAGAQAFDLAQLMSMLARVDRSSVAFEETRHLKALSSPIVRRGTLQYVRPDRLEMQIVTPFPEKMQIIGSRVSVESADGRREWDLSAQPVALAWIEGVRASLAGDAPALERVFRTSVSGSASQWQLRLQPIDPRVAASLNAIDVRGREAQLVTIEIVDGDGDRVVIAIDPPGRGRR